MLTGFHSSSILRVAFVDPKSVLSLFANHFSTLPSALRSKRSISNSSTPLPRWVMVVSRLQTRRKLSWARSKRTVRLLPKEAWKQFCQGAFHLEELFVFPERIRFRVEVQTPSRVQNQCIQLGFLMTVLNLIETIHHLIDFFVTLVCQRFARSGVLFLRHFLFSDQIRIYSASWCA